MDYKTLDDAFEHRWDSAPSREISEAAQAPCAYTEISFQP